MGHLHTVSDPAHDPVEHYSLQARNCGSDTPLPGGLTTIQMERLKGLLAAHGMGHAMHMAPVGSSAGDGGDLMFDDEAPRTAASPRTATTRSGAQRAGRRGRPCGGVSRSARPVAPGGRGCGLGGSVGWRGGTPHPWRRRRTSSRSSRTPRGLAEGSCHLSPLRRICKIVAEQLQRQIEGRDDLLRVADVEPSDIEEGAGRVAEKDHPARPAARSRLEPPAAIPLQCAPKLRRLRLPLVLAHGEDDNPERRRAWESLPRLERAREPAGSRRSAVHQAESGI